MDRRAFLASSLAPALAGLRFGSDDFRSQFPRLRTEAYLNAASLMPLGTFTANALRQGLAFQELGPEDGRADYVFGVQNEIRGLFARLIGAKETEVGLVHCTKAGEQVAIDGLMPQLRAGGNIVTNDLHFSGSLHNLMGLRDSGIDVRVVEAENWQVSADRMLGAMDGQTVLVCTSLVSNINGHIEDLASISEAAHARGALVYADIIQAAGAIPVDLHTLGVDVAAANGYKWLFGVHGAGFLFVSERVQGGLLPDRMYPGRLRHNYRPWSASIREGEPRFQTRPQQNARRYEPGHVNYIGYCAANEGLKMLLDVGTEAALAHASRLTRLVIERLPFRCITPEPERVPIATFLLDDPGAVRSCLEGSGVVVTLSGNRMRVSPTLFNNEDDVDRLISALKG